jgi:hypothetical protein
MKNIWLLVIGFYSPFAPLRKVGIPFVPCGAVMIINSVKRLMAKS